MGRNFITFVLSDSRLTGAELGIAASRAGAVGVVNAELETDESNIFTCLSRLENPQTGARAPYGLKLPRLTPDLAERLAPYVTGNLHWLILESDEADSALKLVKVLKKSGLKLLVECRDDTVPACVEKNVADGVIVKGNESGGYVGEEASFILLQKWVKRTALPLYGRGGMTPHVAAACAAMGIAGGVLDSQVLLLDESPLRSGPLRRLAAALAGSETVAVGDNEAGFYFRVLNHPQLKAAREFIAKGEGLPAPALRDLVAKTPIDWANPAAGLLPVGHDICFAESWRRQYGSLSAVLKAIDSAVDTYAAIAAQNPPLREDGPLAQALGIRLPIVQGPMTRVSDTPEFAQAIADAGALPMLAFALLKGRQVGDLLAQAKPLLAGRKWGVGLLGFVPVELLEEQIAATLPYKPDYAIIAGGRPDQVVALEAKGIPSFLHVPSANLLAGFLKGGARRFIFEGRECGGHIGPLSSFVLWSSMIDRILASLDETGIAGGDLQCLFAGGIHDEFSAALLQIMTAPLIARGVRVGIIMGSAYLFTKEIVKAGAILDRFQKVCVACEKTVILETGPGHVSRCALTPFAATFFKTRRDLKPELAPDALREKLDSMILGTLRVASKGLTRKGDSLVTVPAAEQEETGMYMLGQVVPLRGKVVGVDDLHRQVTQGAYALLEQAAQRTEKPAPAPQASPADIAIVGMACALPGAKDLAEYWENILDQVNAVTEIPKHRWDSALYFDPDRHARDKIYSKWGGFLADMPFDPKKYGITPKSLETVDPLQLMALEIAAKALEDANFRHDAATRERTCVMIGASGGAGDVGAQYGLRAELPRFAGDLPEEVASRLPEWSEDTFAGILMNVVAGRIANRMNLGGANFTTDAACASSMAAIYQAVLDLRAGNSDLAVAGGVDTVQTPFGYLCFSKTQALSPRGVCNTFDRDGDGIVISEGIAMIVLKRLTDAERDGDRIYAVIKGVGAGSDGKAKGLSAPLPEGQLRAMRRAYEQAGFSPATVGLFEAHGTGTVAGDTAELESTGTLLREHGAAPRNAVIGSVKTMIGHTKASAGVAGVVKAAMALHCKILPPHRGVRNPNAVLADKTAPVYFIDEVRPWLHGAGHPRRAAASAFGFGGTNFHLVIEEYRGEYRSWARPAARNRWPAELFVWRGADLPAALTQTLQFIESGPDIDPRDLAFTLAQKAAPAPAKTVCIVAQDLSGLKEKIAAALAHLQSGAPLPSGIYAGDGTPPGKLAVLFPGQGSQYTGMMRETAAQFPACAAVLERADRALADPFEKRFGATLSRFLYPRGAYGEEEKSEAERALRGTDVAQPALGAVEASLWELMRGFGLKADMLAGHSYGEFVALYAAGRITFDELMRLSEARGRLIVDKAREAGAELGTMAAVKASRAEVEAVIKDIGGIVVANHNAPDQVIVSGAEDAVKKACDILFAAEKSVTPLPVAAAFHSPFVEPARASFAQVIETVNWQKGAMPVYANATARPHGADVKKAMADHLVSPVEFVAGVEAMAADGARLFLEIGPKTVLTRLAAKILAGRGCRTVALDDRGGGIAGLLHAMAELLAFGCDLDIVKLFEGRDCLTVKQDDAQAVRRSPVLPSYGWMLNGSGVRRVSDPVRQIGVTAEDRARFAAAPAPAPIATPRPVAPAAQKLSTPTRTTYERPRRTVKKMTDDIVYQRSVAEAYFELLDRQLANARDVALAGMGAEPETLAPPAAVRPSRPAVPPPAARIAAAVPQRREAAPVPEAPRLAQPVPQVQPPRANGNGSGNGVQTPAAAAPAQAKAEAPAAKSGALDQEALKKIILSVVTEKTGYEEDMIAFDQNLEADLGIDSIKRVEIVGSVLEELPSSYAQSLSDSGRSKLSTAATLNAMMTLLREAGGQPANFNQAGAGTTPAVQDSPARRLPRLSESRSEIVAERQEIDPAALRALTAGDFVLTPDSRGVAQRLAAMLEGKGCKAHILPSAALKDEAAFEKWCAAAPSGTIAGIVHLAALDAKVIDPSSSPSDWRAQLFVNEKTLYLLLHRFSAQLADRAHVLAASALGGTFARGETAGKGLSLQGGGPGLIKSFCKERDTIRGKAVDLDPAQPEAALAAQLFAELETDGGRREVGYPGGRRTIFRTRLAPAPEPLADLPPGGLVVLATGGARGVTAEVLREVAKPGSVLVLTGRSALPTDADALRTTAQDAALETEKDLVRHFVKTESMQLGDARKKAAKILAAREQLDNIKDFTQSGATVDYRAVDVTDEKGMKALLDGIYKTHGRLDGIVHGAGIIEDRFLADIAPESWSRVVETKVAGLLLLQKYAKAQTLKFFIVFSSVAGRYGNSGQTNYATANELMNRLCGRLDAQWGGKVRVAALCWGPWGRTKFGAGMVTEATEKKFASYGVHLVTAETGRALFRFQLMEGAGGVEVTCGPGGWEDHEEKLGAFRTAPAPLPLLFGARGESLPSGGVKFALSVDASHPFLQDHIIDADPVFPMAVALETMAQAAVGAFGGGVMTACEIRDGRLFKGIMFEGGRKTADIVVMVEPPDESGAVKAKIVSAGPAPKPHYGATILLSPAVASAQAMPPRIGAHGRPVGLDEAYGRWLFHGPCFQVVTAIDSLSEKDGCGAVRTTGPGDLLGGSPSGGWLFDPAVMDAAAHMSFLWMSIYRSLFALPVKFGRIVRHAQALPSAMTMDYAITKLDGDLIAADVFFYGEDGALLLAVEDMQLIGSPAHKVGNARKQRNVA